MKWILLILILPLFTWAEDKGLRSKVVMEFENDPSAKSYQVEIMQGEISILTQEEKNPNFSLDLAPGSYQIRMRAKDNRGVFGAWSTPEKFYVDARGIDLKPEMNIKKAMNADNPYQPIQVQWPVVPYAEKYLIKIKNKKGEVIIEKKVPLNQTEFSLPPGQYSFNIQIDYGNDIVSPPSKYEPSILVDGGKIPSPKVIWKTDKHGEKFATWTVPQGIVTSAKLEYAAFLSDQWKTVNQNLTVNEINVDRLRPPGRYKITLHCVVDGWESANPSIEEFVVKPYEEELDY